MHSSTRAHAHIGVHMLVGAASSSAAGCITNPIDVIKTEMQLASSKALPAGEHAPGMWRTLRMRVSQQGVFSLWAGVPAMILRSFFYAGVRLGAYQPIKELISTREGSSSIGQKLLAGILSGGTGAAAANPIEVVKTRLQAEPSRYKSTAEAFVLLARKEGVAGLTCGLVPHVLRGAVVTASQVGIYDEVKQRLAQHTR